MKKNAQTPAANASRPVATKDAPKVNLDGWQMTATEITIPGGAPPGRKHRHPGFVIGYVLDGQYSFAVNDQPAKVFKAGEMFFESFDAPAQSTTDRELMCTSFSTVYFRQASRTFSVPRTVPHSCSIQPPFIAAPT